ncbi:hypothetical protein GCM10029963_74660 [Micromonospora andamanensis]
MAFRQASGQAFELLVGGDDAQQWQQVLVHTEPGEVGDRDVGEQSGARRWRLCAGELLDADLVPHLQHAEGLVDGESAAHREGDGVVVGQDVEQRVPVLTEREHHPR